jgi:pimeloyl-[acyl-carrier protein] methyl ester esterase
MSGLHVSTSGSGPDVVLLHGWGLHSGVWQPMIEVLSGDYRVTCIDLPGHGHSDVMLAQDGEAVIDEILQAAPKQAVWAGWSLGGMLALMAALRAPGRVSALMMVAASARFTVADNWPHATSDEVFGQFRRDLDRDYRRTLSRFLLLQTRGSEQAGATLCRLKQDLQQAPPAAQGLRMGLNLLGSLDLRDGLGTLSLPVRLVLGARDTLVPAAVGDDMKLLCPAIGVRELAGCGHAPLLSHPAQCAAVLAELLGEGVE